MLTDVVVVGGGPVGLTAAVLLARAGLDVAVVDRRAGPVTQSRATDLHSRTLEALAPSGLAGTLCSVGRTVDRVEMWSRGRWLGGFGTNRLRSPHPYILTVPQCAVEGVLTEEARKAGVRMHRSADVRALRETPGGVALTTDSSRELRARCAVAADGASSTLRALTGTPFRGTTYPGSWFLADLRVTEPSVDPGRVHMICDPRGLLVVLPMHLEGWVRVVMHRPGPALAGRGAPSAYARDEGGLAGVMAETSARGWTATVREIRWAGSFRIHRRLAGRTPCRRVLLVGDAAHLCSPIGGQGLNLGLRDAVTLAGTLPRALADGGTHQDLLDRWRRDRRADALGVLARTDAATRAWTLRTRAAGTVRDTALRHVLATRAGRHALAEAVAGRAVRTLA
ncbi:FAD-dependent monooxygenase [Streptomyces sp. WAC05374]|uniref:FAD-dependent oxidoreductase n=1 Tax=Streptomyces sp. WAC05374 TaxID=2487420 RepID=UPI000F898463|nr:NAD(P)/FAD-dependent oxidoreductase [Streptomyces sp. WAC05374]RST09549.1 FAD-dependent monooxygenase [Streptomyces sp. WAC05374]TDF54632.1 FAD-dependent monooxygenase [Streptomyces sp. WAC05374]TDF56267.1 FAD-dependent monooxygenase [Streptomyces sp. WAC05374]